MLSSALILAAALAVSTPYTVVLVDGAAIQAVRAPVTRGRVVVATLPDGTSVSITTDKVDWLATEVANRPEVVARRAARAGVEPKRHLIDNRAIDESRRRHGEAAQLPASQRPSLMTVLPEDGGGTAEVGPAAAVARPSTPGQRSEEYWRDRAREMRDRKRRAARDLAAAEASEAREREALLYGRAVTSADGTVTLTRYGRSDEERAVHALLLATLAGAVDRARAGVDEVAAAEDELHEEARIAGADPGWLRAP